MAANRSKLFSDITKESRSIASISHFSLSVRARLEKYPKHVRTDIVTRMKYKSAPLFHACAKGKLQMVEYLISTCGADPEQKGWHGKSKEMVPPLWCATISGKLPVVKCLISHGCQVDALSDGQMTSLQAACSKGPAKLDIVEYLLDHGANVDRGYNNGRTCLMEAVRNVKLCEILLTHGADINATDKERKTALHHAIESQKLDTVKLLLENNADPDLRSRQGDDALQFAVLYGDSPMVLALLRHTSYPPERLADMYELSGSRVYLANENEHRTLMCWRRAIAVRNSNMVDGNPLPKKPPGENFDDDAMETRLCYGNSSEFTTLAELDAIAGNSRAFRIQCLLIRERILGKRHKQMLSSILDTARYFTNDFWPYEHIAHLWIRALESCDAGSTTSFETVCQVAEGLVEEMIQLDGDSREAGNGDREIEGLRFSDIVEIFKLLRSLFSKAWMSQKNLTTEKVRRVEYRYCYDRMAGSITYVIYWLIRTARTSEDECAAREQVQLLIRENPKSIPGNDTLLHFYCATWLERHLEAYGDSESDSPYLQVVKLLLECGALVNMRNASGETPLHKAYSKDFSDSLNKLLIEHGAHLDTTTCRGRNAVCALSAHPDNTIHVENHMTLMCHAARAITKHLINCKGLPAALHEFMELHRPKLELEDFWFSNKDLYSVYTGIPVSRL